jgi:hypothetical protein
MHFVSTVASAAMIAPLVLIFCFLGSWEEVTRSMQSTLSNYNDSRAS